MAKRVEYPGKMPTPFFVQWREYRGWTQGELLDRLDGMGVSMSIGSLSRYENGEQPYSQDVLHALADAFGCEPNDLLTTNPLVPKEVPRLLYDVVRAASPEKQRQALEIVSAFLKAG